MAATSLEVSTLVLAVLVAVLPAAAGAAPLTAVAARRGLAGLVALTLAVTVPGLLAAHGHGDHDHAAGAHTDGHTDGDGHGDAHGDSHDDGEAHAEDAHHDAQAHAANAGHDGGHDAGHEGGHEGEGHDAGHEAGHEGGGHGAGGHGDDHGDDHGGDHGDHGSGGGHAHGAPAERDPLAGPGQVSTLRVGPFTIPAAIQGIELPHTTPLLPMIAPGKLNLLPLSGIPAPCKDCYVLGMQPDLVYADGRDANIDTGPMLHHIVLIDPVRPDPVCGNFRGLPGLLGERVFASGNERTGVSLPAGYGLPFEGNHLHGAVELMNSSAQAKTVYFELKVRWVPQSQAGVKPVRTVWMDLDSCGDSEVDVPAGASTTRWSWTSNLTGRFVGAGGHLHDGGTWLAMHNATRREHICTSVAGYGKDPAYRGALEDMSFCTWDRLGSVRAGDELTLAARYNTTARQPGAMGIMLAFLYETPDIGGGTRSPYPSAPPPDGEAHGGHTH